MPRIIYLCPTDNKPTGGIKVIYRHAAVLAVLGADAYVLHPLDLNFRCTWFDADVRLLDSLDLEPKSDFILIPDLWAGQFAGQCISQGVHYGIFVQNGYLSIPLDLERQKGVQMVTAYRQADLIVVISDDTAEMVKLNYPMIDPKRIVRVKYSIDRRFIVKDPAEIRKTRTITYMPRKLCDHSWRVVFALHQHLPPGWNIASIHDVDEDSCASMLRGSRIFLAFSHFEGLPMPPLEAAVAGNFVIGYTGQGALEYWKPPNFQEIHQGDIIGFVHAAREAARKMDAGKIALPALLQGAARLAERYSPAAEAETLKVLMKRIDECLGKPG
jgi:hypothetical protein